MSPKVSASLYEIPLERLDGTTEALAPYRDHVLLVVNTASKCGFTPQYEALEGLWKKYRERGLLVLGFPCNQFGHQEPGSAEEIETFCTRNYGVSFPMFAKIDVNGSDESPLFRTLKQAAPGVLGTQAIKWNFTKFLVGRGGRSIRRFAPATSPERLESSIENELGVAPQTP